MTLLGSLLHRASARLQTHGLCVTAFVRWERGVSVVAQVVKPHLQYSCMQQCGRRTTRLNICAIANMDEPSPCLALNIVVTV